jgi:lysophospholipase L1-like esterase
MAERTTLRAGRRIIPAVLSCLVGMALLMMIGPSRPAAAEKRTTSSTTYYLALGDSVPVWDGSHSYPNLLVGHYAHQVPGLTLENLAVSGATSSSMLNDGQYQSALTFLDQNVGHVALITIDIGGNDFLSCVSGMSIDQTCITDALAAMDSNITTMLTGLSTAAPSVRIIGMTYYDPYLGDWLAGGSWQTVALDGLSVVTNINANLTTLYGGSSTTANVQAAFKTTNDTKMVQSSWGKVPIDVDRACSWLDITCHVGSTEGFGDDPNIKGQKKIAKAFEHTIGKLQAP